MDATPRRTSLDGNVTVIVERVTHEPITYTRMGTVDGALITEHGGTYFCHECESRECDHVNTWLCLFGF